MFPTLPQARRCASRARVALTLLCALTACAEDPQVVATSARDASVQPRDAGSTDAEAVAVAGDEDATDSSVDVVPSADAGSREVGEPALSPAPPGSLIDHQQWKRVPPADDSFADAPAEVYCGPSATMAELLADEPVFSVDTGFCNYVTVSQPVLRAVAAGETIKLRLWHFELMAPMPAEAHAAVFVDGLAVLDEHIAIPSAGGLLTRQLRAPRAIAAGAPVLFHLHNHGANSWALVEVSAGP